MTNPNPLYIPAHSLCEGHSIDGVFIKSVRFEKVGGCLHLGGTNVIVKLANGKTLNFVLNDEVEVDR